ncbi:MAG: S46 family peptidase [Candidatus Neomarinimicrobiota bacterium]
MKKIFLSFLIFFLGGTVCADEGLWLLNQIADLDLSGPGMTLSAAEIYQPGEPCLAEAVIKLGGGTAAFVSPQGLILTNHHVAFGAVQRASTRGTDYLTNGFLAETRSEEIRAPGYTASLLLEMRDVTGEVLAVAKGITDPLERSRKIRSYITARTDELQSAAEDIEARIVSMNFGNAYYLFIHRRFDDVRVVYMPPQSIGNYGADIDNWMWPRHTGDFAFLRVYVSPDGIGRSYAEDNIPYQPRTWLKIARGDLNEGDQTFIIGYPGRTSRFRTAADIQYYRDYYYPQAIRIYREAVALLDSVGMDSPGAAIKVSGRTKSMNNYLKKYIGVLAGMERYDFYQSQLRKEEQLRKFISHDKRFKKSQARLFDEFDDLYLHRLNYRNRDAVLDLFLRTAGTLPVLVNQLVYTVREREKPPAERDPKFSELEIERYLRKLDYEFYSFYEPAELLLFKYTLNQANNLKGAERIAGLDYLLNSPAGVEARLHEMFAGTKLNDAEYARSLFQLSSSEILALNDPFIDLADRIYREMEDQRNREEEFDARVEELRRKYLEVTTGWEETLLYSEANSTIRFTYGPVAGYQPADAVTYRPFTTIDGMIAKNSGTPPFDVPERLLELASQRDFGDWIDPTLNTVPVAFTHSCDITNGNSGSPVINGRGELIGLAFDGNFEALLSDWKYDPAIQRTISVDIRYVMLITEKFAEAVHILTEMGIR